MVGRQGGIAKKSSTILFHIERYADFRADAFNILNHPTWGNPGNTSSNPSGSAMITGTASEQNNNTDACYFRLSGKFVF